MSLKSRVPLDWEHIHHAVVGNVLVVHEEYNRFDNQFDHRMDLVNVEHSDRVESVVVSMIDVVDSRLCRCFRLETGLWVEPEVKMNRKTKNQWVRLCR